jgi:hypothetical protein
MRIFGLVGLVVALAVVGLLVKKQTTSHRAMMLPGAATTEMDGLARSRQLQSDVRRSLDAAMHAPRDVPDEP